MDPHESKKLVNLVHVLYSVQLWGVVLLLLLPALQVEAAAAAAAKPSSSINPQITVMGMVYCDICSNNTFSSTHSYFLPGVEVKIECMFKAISGRTMEQMSFAVNRTTNGLGIYRLEIGSVDGIECAREKEVGNWCRASLVRSRSLACNIPGSRTSTSDEIAIKSRQANTCIYSLNPLNYRPSTRNAAVCGRPN